MSSSVLLTSSPSISLCKNSPKDAAGYYTRISARFSNFSGGSATRISLTTSPGKFAGGGSWITTTSNRPILRPNSTLPSRNSPWLMLPPAYECGDMVYKFYSLAENKIISVNKRGGGGGGGEMPDDDAEFVGSSHGWLALFNPRNRDLYLSNPLSGRHIKLPPIHALKSGYCVYKIILSASPDEENCRALMSYGPKARLAFCCPSRSTEWTQIGDQYHTFTNAGPRVYTQFVYSNKQNRFFCTTLSGDLEEWDLRDPKSPKMTPIEVEFVKEAKPEKYSSIFQRNLHFRIKYLVILEHTDELLVVSRYVLKGLRYTTPLDSEYHFSRLDGSASPIDKSDCNGDCVLFENCFPYSTRYFHVHKYHPKEKALRYVDGSLDGMALFIGSNHSFAVEAAEFSGLKPNCIYFTDVEWAITPESSRVYPYGGHDIGIFDYEDEDGETILPCYYSSDFNSIKRINPSPMWFTPTAL